MLSPDDVYQICWKNTQCYPWRVNQLGGRYVNGKPLPQDVRMQILQFARIGVRPCDISRNMKITHGCISKLLAKYKKTGSMEPGCLDRTKVLNVNDEKKSRETTIQADLSRSTSLKFYDPPPLTLIGQTQTERSLGEACPSSTWKNGEVIDKGSAHFREEHNTKNRITKPYNHSIDEILNTNDNKEGNATTTHSKDDSEFQESETLEPKYPPLQTGKDAPQTLRKQSQRSHFTKQQIHVLQEEFVRNQYPGYTERQKLCRDLNVNESRIRVWFSNRRAKNRQTSRKIEQCSSEQMKCLCCQRFQNYISPLYNHSILSSDSLSLDRPLLI